jgi:hypothetical protein
MSSSESSGGFSAASGSGSSRCIGANGAGGFARGNFPTTASNVTDDFVKQHVQLHSAK